MHTGNSIYHVRIGKQFSIGNTQIAIIAKSLRI